MFSEKHGEVAGGEAPLARVEISAATFSLFGLNSPNPNPLLFYSLLLFSTSFYFLLLPSLLTDETDPQTEKGAKTNRHGQTRQIRYIAQNITACNFS
jgi:hypothetical protein